MATMYKDKPTRRAAVPRSWLMFLALALLGGIVMIAVPSSRRGGVGGAARLAGQPRTLIVYTFMYTDPEHMNNFNYFVKHGIRGGDGANYVIILDHVIAPELMELPTFPANVQVGLVCVCVCSTRGVCGD